MNKFSESQVQDLRELRELVGDLSAEAVIIGAMAYRLFIQDENRQTYDVDLAVALDLDDFIRLEQALTVAGWRHQPAQEQRWTTPRHNRFDLVPAGPALRKEGKIVWPQSGFVMSLAGFDHVFRDAAWRDIGNGVTYKVVPPPVLALLKMTSYLDDPQRRAKDLLDLQRLMHRYERESERIFSDAVFRADLSDVEFAGAFLLGLDVRAIATKDDFPHVNSFLDRMMHTQNSAFGPAAVDDDDTLRETRRFYEQLTAFAKAFRGPI